MEDDVSNDSQTAADLRSDRAKRSAGVAAGHGETNVHGIRLDLPFAGPEYYLNYEQSWLDFNWRVLEEAREPGRNPLLERIKFVAITASNLDEFFQKRVGGLKRQILAHVTTPTVDGLLPREALVDVRQEAETMKRTMARTLHRDLLPHLKEIGIHIQRYEELRPGEREWADRYYEECLFPILTPLAVDPGHPFPFISNLSLSLGVELKDKKGKWHFARVKVPPVRPRFVQIPHDHDPEHTVFCPIEQIIAANIDSLFTGMEVVSVAAFRLTRSAEVDEYDSGEAEDLLDLISEELRHRRYAPVVRLEVASGVSSNLKDLLMSELNLHDVDVYAIQGLLGMSDLFQIADLGGYESHKLPRWTPKPHPIVALSASKEDHTDMFALLRGGDLLVHHPFHSFESSVAHFVTQAARDPKVLAIKQTLYRTSEDAETLGSLIEAAETGKQVAVLVELKARFDEERNIELAQRLEKAGVHVTYGVLGLKTHCKTTLVVREEEDGIRRYFHIGTGNYNPKTARLYEDLGVFSCDPVVAEDLTRLFNFLTGYAPSQAYDRLLVAPRHYRRRMLELIDDEIAAAKAGQPARILAKMNNLEDPQVIQRLYQASQAGVEIDLIVRSVCRLIAGKPGLSENIRVRSIVGRFLEHSRLFHFHHGGEGLYFMGSGDWMRRNFDNRVEVIVPIHQPELKAYLAFFLELQLGDTDQSWLMQPDGRYVPVRHDHRGEPSSCHLGMMTHAERRRDPIGWHPHDGEGG